MALALTRKDFTGGIGRKEDDPIAPNFCETLPREVYGMRGALNIDDHEEENRDAVSRLTNLPCTFALLLEYWSMLYTSWNTDSIATDGEADKMEVRIRPGVLLQYQCAIGELFVESSLL